MQLKQDTELQNGKYRIIRVLGQGGFGITYLAEHTMLDKMVAIKEFFPKDYCDRDETTSTVTMGTRNNSELVTKLKRRFLKEAKNIAKLDHPGIVKIHDIFEENNTAYYVMDYIKGITLSEMVKLFGTLPEEKAIEYITKVGESLEYMHSNKMTHFDVKPANIIVADKNDMPVLIDFGLSKQYSQEGEETSTLLQAVSSGFSPIELYSPESFSEFSPQTDVYSLGATLYYLLSGCVPPSPLSIIENQFEFINCLSPNLHNPLKQALTINKKLRFESVSSFIEYLMGYRSEMKSDNTIIMAPESPKYSEIVDVKFIINITDVQFYFKRIFQNNSIAYEYYKTAAKSNNPEFQNYLGLMYEFGQGTEIDIQKAYQWYKSAAEMNYADAMYNLGRLSESGLNTTDPYKTALTLYKKAADQGHPLAMVVLGRIYEEGKITECDYSKALEWFNKAIAANFNMGLICLADMYYAGEGVDEDKNKAQELYKKACKTEDPLCLTYYAIVLFSEDKYEIAYNYLTKVTSKGNEFPFAMYWLSILLGNGEGRDKNINIIYDWLKKSANLGCSIAMHLLGFLYSEGIDKYGFILKQDYKEAIKWYGRAVQLMNTDSMVSIGNMYYSGKGVAKDYSKAIEWYRKAADQNNPDAQFELGNMYYHGKGLSKDYSKAVEWYCKAAEQGNLSTMNALGNMYYSGKGVAKDYSKAIEWYRKAADEGYAAAQDNLADMYYDGKGVEQNFGIAIEWYRKAAEQGNLHAMNALGNMYYSGKGVTKDYSKAIEWYRKAADKGYAWSQYNLADMYYNGDGMKRNFTIAKELYEKAAKNRNTDAQNKLRNYSIKVFWHYCGNILFWLFVIISAIGLFVRLASFFVYIFK